METVVCDNDSYNGGWVKLFDANTETQEGDMGQVRGQLPIWYAMGDAGQFNQFMFVDSGTSLDYAVGDADIWKSEGYDVDKHMFIDSDGLFWKIRDRGSDEKWSFSNEASKI